MTAPDEAAAKMMRAAMGIYKTRPERAAMRCVLGDAAGLCDAIASAIKIENKGNHGKGATTKQGRDRAAIAKRCGDAIWEMRKLVGFEDDHK
jgi:hypothetical protein